MNFRYTILYVENVEAAISFYTAAFQLKQSFLHESGDYGELQTGGTSLAFSSRALMRQLGKHPVAPSVDSPTFEIAFETDDVQAALSRAVNAGARLVQGVVEQPWGQTTAYVSDLDGFLVEICSPVQLPSPG